MRALEGRGPLLPDVRLYHSADKALRYLRRHGVDAQVIEDVDAQTWVTGGEAVVVMTYEGDRIGEYALLVHEAVHVVREYFSETLMEEHAGEEMYAYATQAVAGQLMWAHDKWMRKHRGGR
jgi:hypothetical protein